MTENQVTDWVSTGQAARRLQISPMWVRLLINRGTLKANRGPLGWMVNAEDLERYALERAEKQAAKGTNSSESR